MLSIVADNMNWISLISLIVSCVGIPTLATLLVTDLYKRHKEKKMENNDVVKKSKQLELEMSIRNIIHDEIQPMSTDIKELKTDSALTKQGVQATLRHDLYDLADEYRNKGYCPDHIKQDFDNMYAKYHTLGKNGVMDTIYNEIMSLPTYKNDTSKRKKSNIKHNGKAK